MTSNERAHYYRTTILLLEMLVDRKAAGEKVDREIAKLVREAEERGFTITLPAPAGS